MVGQDTGCFAIKMCMIKKNLPRWYLITVDLFNNIPETSSEVTLRNDVSFREQNYFVTLFSDRFPAILKLNPN